MNHSSAAEERLDRALARIDALVDWERRDRKDLERTLDPIRDLVARLENPQRAYRIAHITGTKGKSSTSALIAAGLMAAGGRVGAYSSPHVESIRERVRIDGEWIGASEFAAAIEEALDARDRAATESAPAGTATYFDVLTAAALCAFRTAKVDWVALECGLGGRLDSTNCVLADVCVITNIDLEHTDVLGDTRAKIAYEKVGIVDPGIPLVTGVPSGTEAFEVIERACRERNSELIHVAPDEGSGIAAKNEALARAVLDELHRQGSLDRKGGELLTSESARHARLPGRMETFSCLGRRVLLDGGHVASSVEMVLNECGVERPATCILALRADKDAGAVLKTLRGRVDRVVCTSMDSAPFRAANDLAAIAQSVGLVAEAISDPGEALERALESTDQDGWVLALGSLYLAGALRPELQALI